MSDDVQSAWNRHVEGLIDFAQTYTSNAVERGYDASRNQKLIRKVELVADREIDRMRAQIDAMPEPERKRWTPDCRMGCGHCCYQIVAVTVPELLSFVDYILENCSTEAIDRIRRGARSYREGYESRTPGHHPMLACPVLHEESCGAYEGRCLICRGYNSLNVTRCIERKENPDRPVDVPGVTQLAQVTLNLRTGLRRALGKKGLNPDLVVLGLGLDIALRDPTVAERYYAGENPFESAKLPEEFIDRV